MDKKSEELLRKEIGKSLDKIFYGAIWRFLVLYVAGVILIAFLGKFINTLF